MNVIIFETDGIIGFSAAKAIFARGHFVKLFVTSEVPKKKLPTGITVISKDYRQMNDQELKNTMFGCEAMVFCSVFNIFDVGKPPIKDIYYENEILPLKRIIPIGKSAGVKQFVVLGSLFSYFSKKFSHLKISQKHPFIESQLEKEKVAISFFDKNINICVLEMPHIFGIQKGSISMYAGLISYLRSDRLFTISPKGGAAVITLDQAGSFVVDAVEKNRGSNVYPIGFFNVNYYQLLQAVNSYLNLGNRRVVKVPKFIFSLSMLKVKSLVKKNKSQAGFNLNKLSELMNLHLYFSRKLLSPIFEVEEENLEQVIANTVLYAQESAMGRSQLKIE